ncbi:MAG: ATP-binding protein [Bacteroidia bacterium]
MKLAEVPGQEGVKALLRQGWRSGRIPHAQLLTGPPGSGKLPLALAYAQWLMCHQPGEDDSCGECASCRKVDKLIHPDLHWVFPVIARPGEGDKPGSEQWMREFRQTFMQNPHMEFSDWRDAMQADQKQANISRNECYSILSKLGLSAFEGRYKVVLLWLAEYLGEAGNLLLKLLEEPPERTVFLLVSAQPEQILPTVLSRTRTLRVPPLDPGSIRNYLIETGCTPERASDLSTQAEGNLHKALQGVNEEPYEHGRRFMDLLRLAYSSKSIEVQRWVNEAGDSGRETLKGLMDYGLLLLRQGYLYRYLQNQNTGWSTEESEFISKFSPFISAHSLSAMQEALETAAYRLERNGHQRLVMHNLFFDLQEALMAERKRQVKASTHRPLPQNSAPLFKV